MSDPYNHGETCACQRCVSWSEGFEAGVDSIGLEKKKPIGFDLIDIPYLAMLVSQANSLCMDDENDREQMAVFLMTHLICPMRQRLADLVKKPAVMEGPAPGCVHADDVAAALFGE